MRGWGEIIITCFIPSSSQTINYKDPGEVFCAPLFFLSTVSFFRRRCRRFIFVFSGFDVFDLGSLLYLERKNRKKRKKTGKEVTSFGMHDERI